MQYCIRLFKKKKKKTSGSLNTYFCVKKIPGISRFFILPMEIPDKTRPYLWKFQKTELHFFEVPRTKTKPPLKFYIIFSGSLLEVPLSF